jgi:hypothetical protein
MYAARNKSAQALNEHTVLQAAVSMVECTMWHAHGSASQLCHSHANQQEQAKAARARATKAMRGVRLAVRPALAAGICASDCMTQAALAQQPQAWPKVLAQSPGRGECINSVRQWLRQLSERASCFEHAIISRVAGLVSASPGQD